MTQEDKIRSGMFKGEFTGYWDKDGRRIKEGQLVRQCNGEGGRVEFGRYLDSAGRGHCGFYIRSINNELKGLDGLLTIVD
jgi:hypothetical protein